MLNGSLPHEITYILDGLGGKAVIQSAGPEQEQAVCEGETEREKKRREAKMRLQAIEKG